MRRLLTLCVLLWAAPVWAATYYVRTDGNNANAGTANTSGGAWRTIDYAADHVSAGDTVRVQTGTYSERISPAVSGTSGSPITLVADGAVTFCGIDASGKNYLRIIGFTIDTDSGCAKANRAIGLTGTNTGWEFWHNTIRDATIGGIGHSAYADRHEKFLLIGNTLTAIGGGGTCGTAVSLRGSHSVVAANTVTGVDCDAFVVDGTYNRWLNNVVQDVPDVGAGHSDVFQSNSSSLGLQYNTIEATLALGRGNLSDEHGVLVQNQSTDSCSTGTCADITENLYRRNVWHNQSGAALGVDQAILAGITNTRQVHDAIVLGMRTATSGAYGVLFRGTDTTAWVYNTLHYQSWRDAVTTNVQGYYVDTGAAISGADYNLAFDPDGEVTFTTPWTSQSNPQSNVDPALVDVANDDFTLGSGSGAIGTAGPLTVTSGTGTGTTFNVATGGGGFFRGDNTEIAQYGGALVVGDTITVGTDVVTIASISGDAITVTESFTWGDAEPVYWGSDTTPDIGPFPYKAGGYGLTITHAQVGDTVTVTPSDADLVRWVVCYENGVPVTVDNSSPFTCTVGTGVLAVRAFARYASASPVVQATVTPSAPTTLTIGTDLSLSWAHDRANVTHFTCQIGEAAAVSLGLPTPTETTYASTLAACGTLAAGQQTVRVSACNGTTCNTTTLVVVKLED